MRDIYRGESKWTNDVLCITARDSRHVSKKSARNTMDIGTYRFSRPLVKNLVLPVEKSPSPFCFIQNLQSSGSPSQRICTPEFKLPTVSLSSDSSGYIHERATPSSPSFLSSSFLHNIQERGLSQTKYMRIPAMSESRVVHSSNKGVNLILP